jgi:hypothetical protein
VKQFRPISPSWKLIVEIPSLNQGPIALAARPRDMKASDEKPDRRPAASRKRPKQTERRQVIAEYIRALRHVIEKLRRRLH